MYKTVEELYMHTKSNRIATFVKEWGDEIVWMAEDSSVSEDAEEFYALCMLFLMGHISSVEDLTKIYGGDKRITREFVTTMLSDVTEGMEVTNNIMHIMHGIDKDLRKDGTEEYTRDLYQLTGEYLIKTACPYYTGVMLTGKDPVPEEWAESIKNKVESYGAFCHVTMGWTQSHLYNGDSYRYDLPEAINVEIFADSAEAVKRAYEAVEAMEFHA